MEKITRQQLADKVPANWKRQYKGKKLFNANKIKEIGKKLAKLPKGTSYKVVNSIIGNDSWTNLYCDECEKSGLSSVIVIAYNINICGKCIESLQTMVKKG